MGRFVDLETEVSPRNDNVLTAVLLKRIGNPIDHFVGHDKRGGTENDSEHREQDKLSTHETDNRDTDNKCDIACARQGV